MAGQFQRDTNAPRFRLFLAFPPFLALFFSSFTFSLFALFQLPFPSTDPLYTISIFLYTIFYTVSGL